MRIITAAGLALSLLGLSACTQPWKAYDYPAWGFSISYRDAPKAVDTPASAKDGTAHSFKTELVQGDRDLVVMVTDASGTDKTDEQILSDIPSDMLRNSGGSVIGHANVTASGVAGREMTIDKGADPTERFRVFVSHRRIYQIITRSPQGPTDPEAAAFLDSFKLTGQ